VNLGKARDIPHRRAGPFRRRVNFATEQKPLGGMPTGHALRQAMIHAFWRGQQDVGRGIPARVTRLDIRTIMVSVRKIVIVRLDGLLPVVQRHSRGDTRRVRPEARSSGAAKHIRQGQVAVSASHFAFGLRFENLPMKESVSVMPRMSNKKE
jgi:hypothetical protein